METFPHRVGPIAICVALIGLPMLACSKESTEIIGNVSNSKTASSSTFQAAETPRHRSTTTAQDYYYLLIDEARNPIQVHTEEEIREILNRRKEVHPDLLEADTSKLAEASDPTKKYAPLLDRVLEGIPNMYKIKESDIFAAEFPLDKINARTLRSPNGGLLIMINRGMSKSFHEWAKLLVNIMILQRPEPGASGLSPDGSLEEMTQLFVRSLWQYRRFSMIPAFPEYSNDKKGILAGLIEVAAFEFVIAHEYAHAFLGHVTRDSVHVTEVDDHTVSGNLEDTYNKEIEADKIAIRILLNKDLDSFDIDTHLAGIIYSIMLFEMIEITGEHNDTSDYSREAVGRVWEADNTIKSILDTQGDYFIGMHANQALSLVLNRLFKATASGGEFSSAPTTKPDDKYQTLREFYIAYLNRDWSAMQATARRLDDPEATFTELLGIANLLAKRFDGQALRVSPEWSNGDMFGPSEFVRVAVWLYISSENTSSSPQDAVLEKKEMLQVLETWTILHQTALLLVGAHGDPKPRSTTFSRQKLKHASEIADEIGGDLGRLLNALCIQANVWISARSGESDQEEFYRKQINDAFADRLSGVPIVKTGANEYIISGIWTETVRIE